MRVTTDDSPTSASTLARELADARRDRVPVAPFSGRGLLADEAAAYAVQAAGISGRRADGEVVVGAKLGFTSRAMRRAMGVATPNLGWLTDVMVVTGRDTADVEVDLATLIHPKVEPELAVRLRHDLGPGAGPAAVRAAIDVVAPCLEVVDSRWRGFRFGPLDNIADNSSSGVVVLGGWVDPDDRDLAAVGCLVHVNGVLAETAAVAAAMDGPVPALQWLATHASRPGDADGRPLRAGDVVITGGLTAPATLVPGRRVTVHLDGLGGVGLVATGSMPTDAGHDTDVDRLLAAETEAPLPSDLVASHVHPSDDGPTTTATTAATAIATGGA